MSDRLDNYLEGLKQELTGSEIAACIGNGEIDVPEWISVAEDTDHLKLIDNETTESFYMGFTTIWYSDEAE